MIVDGAALVPCLPTLLTPPVGRQDPFAQGPVCDLPMEMDGVRSIGIVVQIFQSTKVRVGSTLIGPEDIPDAARGANAVRRLVSSLGTVAQAVSELRNLYGTGHEREGLAQGLRPRHARLAVGAASTLATFLLETHEERG